jgi:hypothetical protein
VAVLDHFGNLPSLGPKDHSFIPPVFNKAQTVQLPEHLNYTGGAEPQLVSNILRPGIAFLKGDIEDRFKIILSLSAEVFCNLSFLHTIPAQVLICKR